MACRRNLLVFLKLNFAHRISQSLSWLEDTMSFRTSKKIPLPAVLRSFRYAVYFSGNNSLDFMLLLSQDSDDVSHR